MTLEVDDRIVRWMGQRKSLDNRRATLLASAGRASEDDGRIEGATLGETEHLSVYEQRDLQSVLDSMQRRELAMIDAAMRRIDDGTYETCARCAGAIPTERLEAMPVATTCVDCAGS